MNADDPVLAFDQNAHQHAAQVNRHSPPALDDGQGYFPGNARRPANLLMPQEGNEDYNRYIQIRKNFKEHETISDLSYHLRKYVKEALNTPMDSGCDWRGVASRLRVRPRTIQKLEAECKEDPTLDPTDRIFCETAHKKIKEFLQVLYHMERHDVLNIFHDDLSSRNSADTEARRKEYKASSSKFPSQESTPSNTPNSANSSASGYISSPSQFYSQKGPTPDSSEARSDSAFGSTRSQPPPSRPKSGSFAKQNTDEDLGKYLKTTLTFHSSDSKNFWHKILPKPDSTRKEWKEFEKTLKKGFPKETAESSVMRLICYVLKIEPYEERHNKYVNDRDFANLVAWFGPVKSGEGGLFTKIAQLIKHSTTYKANTGPHSFFAGYMTKEEADNLIGNAKTVGTFLIRFSSTFAGQGSFVVCLKTETGTEHVLLEGDPNAGKIKYDGKDYDDLITLYRRALCRGGVSQNRRTSCTTICPDLPLNAMFKPYGPGPRPPPVTGRGRGRGRGAEQQNR